MDCSLPGFSVHGIFQARVLEWVAIVFSERLEPKKTFKCFHTTTCICIKVVRYADDTTVMAESEEELKSLLMKVKVESKRVG